VRDSNEKKKEFTTKKSQAILCIVFKSKGKAPKKQIPKEKRKLRSPVPIRITTLTVLLNF
jgi:hypothetical protein